MHHVLIHGLIHSLVKAGWLLDASHSPAGGVASHSWHRGLLEEGGDLRFEKDDEMVHGGHKFDSVEKFQMRVHGYVVDKGFLGLL